MLYRNVLLSSLIMFPFVGFAGSVYAEDCSCEANLETDSVFEATSDQGRTIKLRFAAKPVSTASTEADLCFDPSGTPTEAKLWMPSMGHGSSPTTLQVVNDNCAKIERIAFLMGGDWEIKTSFSDGDKGTFSFNILED